MRKKIKILLFCFLLSLPTLDVQAEFFTLAGFSAIMSQYGVYALHTAAANPWITGGIAAAITAGGGALYKAYYSGLRGQLKRLEDTIDALSVKIEGLVEAIMARLQPYFEESLAGVNKNVIAVNANLIKLAEAVEVNNTETQAKLETQHALLEAQGKQLDQANSYLYDLNAADLNSKLQGIEDGQTHLLEGMEDLREKVERFMSEKQQQEGRSMLPQQSQGGQWTRDRQKEKESKHEQQFAKLEQQVSQLSAKLEQSQQLNMPSGNGSNADVLAVLMQQGQQIQQMMNMLQQLLTERAKKEVELQKANQQLAFMGAAACGLHLQSQQQGIGGGKALPWPPHNQDEFHVRDFSNQNTKTPVLSMTYWNGSEVD